MTKTVILSSASAISGPANNNMRAHVLKYDTEPVAAYAINGMRATKKNQVESDCSVALKNLDTSVMTVMSLSMTRSTYIKTSEASPWANFDKIS